MGKGPKAPRRPSYTRCGDKKLIFGYVIPMTFLAMFRHWRELPEVWRETKGS